MSLQKQLSSLLTALGKPKRPRETRRRNYEFIWNWPKDHDGEDFDGGIMGMLDLSDFPHATYLIYSEEIGDEEGRYHLQGYVEFDRPVLMKNATSVPGISFCYGRDQHAAIAYVSKRDHTWVDGPYEFGLKKQMGERTDLKEVVDLLKSRKRTLDQIQDEFPTKYCQYRNGLRDIGAKYQLKRTEMTECHVLWGDSGTGKTTFCKEFTDAYWKEVGDVWWDDYSGEEIVIIDEFEGEKHMPFSTFKKLINHCPTRVQFKGGSRQFISKKVYITSNYDPMTWYKLSSVDMDAFKRRLTSVTHFVKPSADSCT